MTKKLFNIVGILLVIRMIKIRNPQLACHHEKTTLLDLPKPTPNT